MRLKLNVSIAKAIKPKKKKHIEHERKKLTEGQKQIKEAMYDFDLAKEMITNGVTAEHNTKNNRQIDIDFKYKNAQQASVWNQF